MNLCLFFASQINIVLYQARILGEQCWLHFVNGGEELKKKYQKYLSHSLSLRTRLSKRAVKVTDLDNEEVGEGDPAGREEARFGRGEQLLKDWEVILDARLEHRFEQLRLNILWHGMHNAI